MQQHRLGREDGEGGSLSLSLSDIDIKLWKQKKPAPATCVAANGATWTYAFDLNVLHFLLIFPGRSRCVQSSGKFVLNVRRRRMQYSIQIIIIMMQCIRPLTRNVENVHEFVGSCWNSLIGLRCKLNCSSIEPVAGGRSDYMHSVRRNLICVQWNKFRSITRCAETKISAGISHIHMIQCTFDNVFFILLRLNGKFGRTSLLNRELTTFRSASHKWNSCAYVTHTESHHHVYTWADARWSEDIEHRA